ncbi:MAG: hypothetical protein ABF507_09090, partial [Bifidobacterium aquikefiri]|uniref:hypothetical protein n=1 Tax=Bifidobacterium aquikefiri TaxID=1653207 RepID=UPI0039E8A313
RRAGTLLNPVAKHMRNRVAQSFCDHSGDITEQLVLMAEFTEMHCTHCAISLEMVGSGFPT